MIDRRDFWAKASAEDVARACDHCIQHHGKPEIRRVVSPITDLCAEPGGARDRQLRRGQRFDVHALSEEGWAFGETVADRYSGWIDATDLVNHPNADPTHRIAVAHSYGKSTPGLKTPGHTTPLSLGSELVVLDEADGWSRVAWERGLCPFDLYVPTQHLVPADTREVDPVDVASRLVGTPYLWGGNSAFGIDCSGLVQIACHACGIPCPGDSDQQGRDLGETLAEDTPPRRGDLLFWKGHVGWVSDPETLLHANAHHMSVTYEPLKDAISRIASQGDGAVTRHARLN